MRYYNKAFFGRGPFNEAARFKSFQTNLQQWERSRVQRIDDFELELRMFHQSLDSYVTMWDKMCLKFFVNRLYNRNQRFMGDLKSEMKKCEHSINKYFMNKLRIQALKQWQNSSKGIWSRACQVEEQTKVLKHTIAEDYHADEKYDNIIVKLSRVTLTTRLSLVFIIVFIWVFSVVSKPVKRKPEYGAPQTYQRRASSNSNNNSK